MKPFFPELQINLCISPQANRNRGKMRLTDFFALLRPRLVHEGAEVSREQ
jgi:hypothetical protein